MSERVDEPSDPSPEAEAESAPERETASPFQADERRARRAIMRAARLLIGTILLLFAIGLVYRLVRNAG
jgi:hypothetical protein